MKFELYSHPNLGYLSIHSDTKGFVWLYQYRLIKHDVEYHSHLLPANSHHLLDHLVLLVEAA